MMMTRSLLQFLLCMLIGVLSFAQENVVTISTDKYAMVMQTDDDQRLCIVYSGKKLNNDAEYVKVKSQYHLRDDNSALSNVAYTPAGTWNLVEPAIAVHGHGDPRVAAPLRRDRQPPVMVAAFARDDAFGDLALEHQG